MKTNEQIHKLLTSLEKLSGEEIESTRHEAIGLSESDWSYLIEYLLLEGLIDGYRRIKVDGATHPLYIETNPTITIKGRMYLEANTRAAKLVKLTKNTKDTIPFL